MFWTYIFLTVLIAYTLTRIFLILRHSHHIAAHRNTVPKAFASYITLAQHQKAADYTQAKIKWSLMMLAIELLVLMAWTLGGGLKLINHLLSQLDIHNISRGVLLFTVFSAIGMLVELPLSWFKTFKLEEKFGFNRSTQATFWIDTIKQTIIGTCIGLPVLAAVLWIMQTLGNVWWIWAGSLLIGFNLLMLSVYPTWIAPLFNQFTPLNDSSLKTRIENLAKRCQFNLTDIFIMDGSKRSGHGNAYFTGLGKNKRIVFFDTLLNQLNPEETEAVLAHELGHYYHKHVIKRMLWMFISLFIMLAIIGYLMQEPIFFQTLGVPFKLNGDNHAMALLLFSMVSGYVLFFLNPISNYLSRKHEFEADAFAVKHTHSKALQTALLAMYRDNASTLTPDPWYSLVFDSHPPAPIRIAALQSIHQ